MDGKTVSNEEKYFEIFEKLKNFGFRKDIQFGVIGRNFYIFPGTSLLSPE